MDHSTSSFALARSGPLLASLSILGGAAVMGVACELPQHGPATEVEGGDCVVCHRDDYEAALNPVHVDAMPLTCAGCHGYDAWSPSIDFEHTPRFPLRFAHAAVDCADCHTGGYEPGATDAACVACHRDDYDAAEQPPHDGYPLQCADCHDERGFSPSTFAHDWPLEGKHVTTACQGCHTGDPPRYEGTPTACVDCHRGDYDAASDPPHDGFSTDCASCHDPSGWRGAGGGDGGFVHPWPLRGAHATADCAGCHVGEPPVYAGTPTACVDCHRDDYAATTRPPHDGFSTDCASCHDEGAWQGAVADPAAGFVHPWPLRGAHVTAECAGCHGDPPVYAGTAQQCVDCHADDRDRAQPPHGGFSSDCASCHGEQAFRPASFDHPWPLDGAHASADCGGCHVGDPPVYAGTPRQCVDCHRADYDGSPFPGHDAFSTDCTGCHSTSAWTPASGGHPQNRFSITGRHDYACMDCHNAALGPNGRDNTDCVGCHTGAHSRSRMDAEHREESRYPTGDAQPNFCLDCHPDGNG